LLSNRVFAAALAAASVLFVATPAVSGEFGAAFKAGDLIKAEAIRDGGGATNDFEDGPAACALLLFENRAPEATDCYRGLSEAAPDNVALLGALANAAFRAGDYHTAAEAFTGSHQPPHAVEASRLAVVPSAYQIVADKPSAVVPFVQADLLPIVKVHLPDDRDHLFAVDTAVAETILDPNLAAALGIVDSTNVLAGALGGKGTPLSFAILPRMALGDFAIERMAVALRDIAKFIQVPAGVSVEGVIGVDLLRRFVATIDYPNRELVLARQAPDMAGSVPFWLASDRLILAEAAINGTRELALLDTGFAGQACTLPRSVLGDLGETPEVPTEPAAAAKPVAVTAKSIELAGVSQENVPCLAGPFPRGLETTTGARIGLLVSDTYLKRYAVTLDFQAMRMTLREPPALPQADEKARAN
jgi:hypothetical protein